MAKTYKKNELLNEVNKKLFLTTSSGNKRKVLDELVNEGKILKINNYYVQTGYYNNLLDRIYKEISNNLFYKPSDGNKKKLIKEILNEHVKNNKIIKLKIGNSEIFIKKQDTLIPPIFDIVKDINEFYISLSPDKKFGFSVPLENLINYLTKKFFYQKVN